MDSRVFGTRHVDPFLAHWRCKLRRMGRGGLLNTTTADFRLTLANSAHTISTGISTLTSTHPSARCWLVLPVCCPATMEGSSSNPETNTPRTCHTPQCGSCSRPLESCWFPSLGGLLASWDGRNTRVTGSLFVCCAVGLGWGDSAYARHWMVVYLPFHPAGLDAALLYLHHYAGSCQVSQPAPRVSFVAVPELTIAPLETTGGSG